MTYEQDEASREDGNPVELYEFVGTVETWRYTSAMTDIDFGGFTYIAIPIRRSALVIPPDGDAPELAVTLPITADIVANYVFQIAPPKLVLTITRLHVSTLNSGLYWRGPVTGWTVKEREVSARVPHPLAQKMEDKIPAIHYQPYCNNVLFDNSCQEPTAGNFEATTVITISGDGRTITVLSMGARANDFAKGGDIVSTVTGERRMILSQIGPVLTILWPFSIHLTTSAPNDAVNVFAGCDHSLDDCVNKFDNVENFTGMPFIVSQELNSTQNGN